MRNILGLSHHVIGDTYYPLESTVHISHIAQHAVAGERHAFSFEEDRSQETEDRMREAATAVISSGPRPEGEGSREILSYSTSRRNSRNSGNSRHFERSGAESRNPFMQKHCEERKNLTQITRIFTELSVRRQIMLASERITQSWTERKREQPPYQSAGWLALASTKCGRKICDNQRNLREIIS